ncbi:uncharacterized protein SPSK_07672 [Sporothrix schenckii 1099-18]|uniref:Glycoside hydrolase 131 catalytic N-terminal domain-containing protein n=1 Tax=Sporothrix schenckii 1099-18 TaxID=1397361 RepID=A0A0F2MF73_SPOSC|nr:uncharacterized protein SPSK_07672 [Sporothrix schenckii 1099-18]KJR88348.1 hypothetical protein SPSK_07672 [Sporothrix schenckii 1099-18]
MMYSLSIAFLALPLVASAQKCTIQFDGRVPSTFTAASFDTNNNLFSPSNVFGQGLKFSQLIQLPAVTGSLFDVNTVPAEVTISDKSIFAPSADNVQTGFRRAELLPASNSGTDPSTQGVKTLHFSVMQDAQRPLNLTHEYQLVFLESNDFSTNQLVLKAGTVLGQAGNVDPNTLQLFGNVNSNPPQVLFSTPFTPGVFHNFAVTLDFNKLTSQVFFSTGTTALKSVTQALANDVSGQGQFHFGVLKKPVNPGADIVHSGTQEPGINEGVIFGGIFEEDSSTGCVSLSP